MVFSTLHKWIDVRLLFYLQSWYLCTLLQGLSSMYHLQHTVSAQWIHHDMCMRSLICLQWCCILSHSLHWRQRWESYILEILGDNKWNYTLVAGSTLLESGNCKVFYGQQWHYDDDIMSSHTPGAFHSIRAVTYQPDWCPTDGLQVCWD